MKGSHHHYRGDDETYALPLWVQVIAGGMVLVAIFILAITVWVTVGKAVVT